MGGLTLRPSGKGCGLLAPATFVLADGTAFLQVSVQARPWCSAAPPPETPDVREGDRVEVEAQVRVTESYAQGTVQRSWGVLAIEIRPIP